MDKIVQSCSVPETLHYRWWSAEQLYYIPLVVSVHGQPFLKSNGTMLELYGIPNYVLYLWLISKCLFLLQIEEESLLSILNQPVVLCGSESALNNHASIYKAALDRVGKTIENAANLTGIYVEIIAPSWHCPDRWSGSVDLSHRELCRLCFVTNSVLGEREESEHTGRPVLHAGVLCTQWLSWPWST